MARSTRVQLPSIFRVLSQSLDDEPEQLVTVTVWPDGHIRVLSNLPARHTQRLLQLGEKRTEKLIQFLEDDGA